MVNTHQLCPAFYVKYSCSVLIFGRLHGALLTTPGASGCYQLDVWVGTEVGVSVINLVRVQAVSGSR